MTVTRRLFLRSAPAFLAAPSIVRAASLMPVTLIPVPFDIRARAVDALTEYWVERDADEFIRWVVGPEYDDEPLVPIQIGLRHVATWRAITPA